MSEANAWAYWDNLQKCFKHVYDTEQQVRLCGPSGYLRQEENGIGIVCPVHITQVPVEDDLWARCEEPECGASYRQSKFKACPKCVLVALAASKHTKPIWLKNEDMEEALKEIRR